MTSLTVLFLNIDKRNYINDKFSNIFENLSSIKELNIYGVLDNFNLDFLVNLKSLKLSEKITNDFNFGLFNNLSNNLRELSISISNIDDEQMTKLFYNRNFPCLEYLEIKFTKITKLEKWLFDGFPNLQNLFIAHNKELRQIDNDVFSSLTDLGHLRLNNNCIKTIKHSHFSKLINLHTLNLNANRIEFIEENCFSNLKNLISLSLMNHKLLELNPQLFNGLENLKELCL